MSDFTDDSKTPIEEITFNDVTRLERKIKTLEARIDDRDAQLAENRKLFYEVTFGPLAQRVEWNTRMIWLCIGAVIALLVVKHF